MKLYLGNYFYQRWKTSLKAFKNYNDLPKNAKDYIKRIEDLAKVPITWIGTGPERESIIQKN